MGLELGHMKTRAALRPFRLRNKRPVSSQNSRIVDEIILLPFIQSIITVNHLLDGHDGMQDVCVLHAYRAKVRD